MTKQEFEERAGKKVSLQEWNIIETVYTWHPSISEENGKDEIVEIYHSKIEGFAIIKEMYEAATMIDDLDKERRKLEAALEKVRKRMNQVAKGNLVYERCRRDAEKYYEKSNSADQWDFAQSLLSEKYGEQTVTEVIKDTGLY